MAENNLIEVGRLNYAKSHMISGFSGALTGLAANAVVAAIRNIGPAELIVDSVDMGFTTTTGTGAAPAGSLAFGLYKVPGFTALTNAGARATPPAPVRKRNAEHFALPAAAVVDPKFDTAVQVQVGGVAALTGLTLSPALVVDDPQAIWVAETIALAANTLYEGSERAWEPRNHIPFTLGPDEGLVFTTRFAFPGTLAGQFFFGVDVHIA